MPEFNPDETIAKIANSEVIGISIDTCIFDSKGRNFQAAILKSLDQFKGSATPVYLSNIVLQEVQKHIADQALKSQDTLKTAIRKQAKAWNVDLSIEDDLPDKFAASKDVNEFASAQFGEYLELIGAETVGVGGELDVSEELVQRYFDCAPPFEDKADKKSEFPDGFALLSLEKLAEQKNGLIICVSSDVGWQAFAKDSLRLVCVSKLEDALSYFNQSQPAYELAEAVIEDWRSDEFSIVHEEMRVAFEKALFDLNFHVEAESHVGFESDIIEAEYESIDLEDLPAPKVISVDNSEVVFSLDVSALIHFSAEFNFFVIDSVDGDDVLLNCEIFDTAKEVNYQVTVKVTADEDGHYEILDVEVGKKRIVINFGEVEPFPYEDPSHEKY